MLATLDVGPAAALENARATGTQSSGPGGPKLYSMELRDVDIREVLLALSEESGMNIVIGEEVKGKVTVSFEDVDLFDALDAILSTHGYNYYHHNKIIQVSGLDTEQAGFSMATFTVRSINVSDIEENLANLTSSGAKIILNTDANSVTIIDLPANLKRVAEYLDQIDIGAGQVRIEARIVEFSLENGKETGVSWTWYDADIPDFEDLRGILSQNASAQSDAFSYIASNEHIDAQLQAIATQKKAKLLSSPSIVTLSGAEAEIKIGDRVPYIQSTTTETVTVESVSFEDVGIILSVIPYVGHDGYITMYLHPEVSEVTGWTEDNQPIIATREATTQARVKQGETIVIGGLIKNQETNDETKVPLLGDIPVLGYLFKNRQENVAETELVIFVTPHLISDDTMRADTQKKRMKMEDRGIDLGFGD
jgi:type II secretory pathway component GspD/PulD (secretin)